MASKYNSLYERLVANTAAPENDRACWIWTSATTKRGYGKLNIWRAGGLVQCMAHRLMYQLFHCKPVEHWIDDWSFILVPPDELQYDETVDHICETTECINPDHLRLLSRVDNTKRMRGTL